MSEHDLVHTIDDLYGGGLLDMAQDSPEVSSLGDGLLDYMEKEPEADIVSHPIEPMPHREVRNDSLVLGAALACWYGEQLTFDDPAEDLEEEVRAIAERIRIERSSTAT